MLRECERGVAVANSPRSTPSVERGSIGEAASALNRRGGESKPAGARRSSTPSSGAGGPDPRAAGSQGWPNDRRLCANCRRVSPRCAADHGSASGLKKTVHASEHARADVRLARTAWRAAAPTLESRRASCFSREWCADRSDSPLWPRAVRRPGPRPHAGWRLATPRRRGVAREGLTAPAVFDGPIDGASFLAYIEQVLMPTLAPGDIVTDRSQEVDEV